ncbi:alpha/beta hydrolase [Sphingobium sp. HBC34]|uniref:Alpha/beta hydrolase n=1 Tax=Sphingobium cyanobacteriorum TaxID=3063954 RepID=A0ABT8ZHX1_9SPHN|nr:alpha/beta hydrolase [Sphingobium sp. HBC34]MDO7834140.1 alpha/beta hydrolase [Sphingobium sp. HBC34]
MSATPSNGPSLPDVPAQIIPLWNDTPPGGARQKVAKAPPGKPELIMGIANPRLHMVRPAKPNGQAILVIPGGGYTVIALQHEGFDVAHALVQRGFVVFILEYRLPDEGWNERATVALQDGQRAMRQIRASAAQYGFSPDAVSVLGFSAGGHLAASLLTGADHRLYEPRDAIDQWDARPRVGGLIYPVTLLHDPFGVPFVTEALLGKAAAPDLLRRHSPADSIGPDTPPAFLVHAFDDDVVPYQNAVLFAEAMRASRRPVELHLFEKGGHGFGLGAPDAPAGHWLDLFTAFLRRH